MAVYLLPDGTTVVETGNYVYPTMWGTVIETVSTPTVDYNISNINSIPILSIGKINTRALSGIRKIMSVNIQTS
jgi:hypothetical protein